MSDRLTTSQRKAKECMQKAEDLCAVGDTDEATRLYEKAHLQNKHTKLEYQKTQLIWQPLELAPLA